MIKAIKNVVTISTNEATENSLEIFKLEIDTNYIIMGYAATETVQGTNG